MPNSAKLPTQAAEYRAIAVEVPPGYVPPFKEPLPVAELLVDGIATAALTNGLLRLALFVERSDPTDEGTPIRPIVCRLVMTPAAAALIKHALSSILDQMVATGVIDELPSVTEKE
jgi:hypothetical protein